MKQETVFCGSGFGKSDATFRMDIMTTIRGITTTFDTGVVMGLDEMAAHWQQLLNVYMVDMYPTDDDDGYNVVIYAQRGVDLDDLIALARQLRMGVSMVSMSVQGEYMMRVSFVMGHEIPF